MTESAQRFGVRGIPALWGSLPQKDRNSFLHRCSGHGKLVRSYQIFARSSGARHIGVPSLMPKAS